MEVRWGIFLENLTVLLLPKRGRWYSHKNSYFRHDSYFARWSSCSWSLSCLWCKWTGRVMCARCCLAFGRVNRCFFYENVWPMSSSYLQFCHNFDQLVTWLRVVQFWPYSYSWLTKRTPVSHSSDFVNHSYDYRPNCTSTSVKSKMVKMEKCKSYGSFVVTRLWKTVKYFTKPSPSSSLRQVRLRANMKYFLVVQIISWWSVS